VCAPQGLKEFAVRFLARLADSGLTAPIHASATFRTLRGAMLSQGNAAVRRAGEAWNVILFVKMVAGEKVVNRNVIVKMGRVIPRMASVLAPGDLLDKNVKSPALKDITALTVYKSAPDVTQRLMNVTQ